MAPHAEGQNGNGTTEAVASNGHTVPVNEGQAPLEPGIKKTIAQGKMTEFPRFVSHNLIANFNRDNEKLQHVLT